MTTDTVDVYILGTGMVSARQLTREAEQALDRVGDVYLLHPLPEVRALVRDRCDSVVDLTDEYERGSERSDSYEAMARRVLDRAADADDPIAFAVYGHPTAGVTPTELIRKRATDRDMRVEIVPGISSLDCLYAELGIDPFARGMQVFEATDLLLYDIDLDPETPAFVVQVGLTGTRLYDDRDSLPERFTPLKRHLLQFYPPDHTVSLVRTATMAVAESERISVALDDFETVAGAIDNTHSLFVPPVGERTLEREELAEKAYTREHLDRVTE